MCILLKLDNIKVSYSKSRVIHGVSLTVNPGEKICLMGRNGVGKTTLLKSIIGIQQPEDGKILFEENNITKSKTYQRSKLGIAYVPQGREIIPMLTVKENLFIGCVEHYPKELNQLMEEVLNYFPALRQHLDRKGGVLSGGQQQQLAIARALMSKPKILILDEPSEGIQPNVVAEIAEILNRVRDEKNIAIFIVEQNLDFASKIADKYYVMEKGVFTADGDFKNESIEHIKQYLTI